MKKTWIKIKRGILEPKHIDQLGQAWYLYFYILDQADWETGTVKNWKDSFAADDLGKPIGLIREHRKKLFDEKYIKFIKGQHNQTIIINNWTDPRRYDFHVINPTGQTSEESERSRCESEVQSESQTTFEQAQNNVPSYNHISHNNISTISQSDKPTYYQPCDDDGLDLTPQQELKLKQQHPAYIAYYHVTKKRPKNELIDLIIEKIGDFPDQSNLEACRLEWLSRGYNPMSLKWLDWYVNGIPGYQKNNVQESNNAILKQAMEEMRNGI
jgi:hypothetical protein